MNKKLCSGFRRNKAIQNVQQLSNGTSGHKRTRHSLLTTTRIVRREVGPTISVEQLPSCAPYQSQGHSPESRSHPVSTLRYIEYTQQSCSAGSAGCAVLGTNESVSRFLPSDFWWFVHNLHWFATWGKKCVEQCWTCMPFSMKSRLLLPVS